MNERHDPMLGSETVARICNKRVSGGRWDGEICGDDARFHVFWDLRSLQNSFTCLDHAREATEHFDAAAWHLIGPVCGINGSHYDEAGNVCFLPDGELPVAERAEVEVTA